MNAHSPEDRRTENAKADDGPGFKVPPEVPPASESEAPPTPPNADAENQTDAAPHSDAAHQRLLARIQNLPASVGVVLMGVGVAGLIIPGPFGTPFILTGGLILAPRVFRSVDRFVQRRFPIFYDAGMQSVERFLSDMEKRYPRRK